MAGISFWRWQPKSQPQVEEHHNYREKSFPSYPRSDIGRICIRRRPGRCHCRSETDRAIFVAAHSGLCPLSCGTAEVERAQGKTVASAKSNDWITIIYQNGVRIDQ